MVFRSADWMAAGGRGWCGLVWVLVAVGCGFGRPGLAGAEGMSCANEQLRSEQSYGQALPDCRAFEMVSPLAKGDNGISFSDARASVSGESPAITYFSPGSFSGSGPEPAGAAVSSRYLSLRESDGWSTENITPPYATFLPQIETPFHELLFNPTLSRGVLKIRFTSLVPGEAGDPAAYVNLYLAETDGDAYQRVTTATPSELGPYEESTTGQTAPYPAGASADLTHVVFEQEGSLTEGATPRSSHVYEASGGRVSLVDVPPEGGTLDGDDSVGAPGYFISPPADSGDPWHAVSADGSRVFFTGGEKQYPTQPAPTLGQLFLRENPERPPANGSSCAVAATACTIEVSASQRTNAKGEPNPDPQGIKPAYFRDASADGSRVFFTSRSELTNNANTGPADNAANLYACELAEVAGAQTCRLTDLTPGAIPTDLDGAAVLGLVNASEDGSYVYFVANGVLSAAPNSEGETATPGTCKVEAKESTGAESLCNLYVAHYNGSAWEAPRFIARLAGGEYNGGDEEESGDGQDWVGYEYEEDKGSYKDFGPGQHTARVTPDGTRLAFESERRLTGYDNERAEPGECESSGGAGERRGETGRCREVYLYDALTGKLVCASCDRSLPSGAVPARPVGPAELGGQEEDPEGDAFEQLSGFYLPRNLSEDGGRLFFQSPDPLVSGDSNGLLDVYEWEQDGSGTCRQEDGCVLAISDAAGGHESHFMDASASGEDVFIATADQLLPSDTDTRVDVYDARVDGGFPVTAAAPVCDNADSCKPPASPQPASVLGAPSSATFSGPGDLLTAPAATPAKAIKKALTRAQKLSRALRACERRPKRRRATCERAARRRYGSGVSSSRRASGGGGGAS